MKEVKKLTTPQLTVLFISILVPLAIAISTVVSGNIDFGYDHARDFLLGLGNHQKLTLIGPTSGIPGLFYGPYWIWLLSFGLLFSHDPRIVVFIILTLPYFVIFPYVLFVFRKMFSFATILFLWLIFVFSTGIKYATSPWNPHPAPLLFLVLIYAIVFANFSGKGIIKYLKLILIGILSGLIINFHISLGLGILAGVIFYYFINFIMEFAKNKNRRRDILFLYLSIFVSFGLGIAIAFFPFFLFETRHGFNQVKTTLNVFSAKGSVVGVKGLNKVTILESFFGAVGNLLKIPKLLGIILFIIAQGYFYYLSLKKKIALDSEEKKLFILTHSLIFGILFLYLTSKNPVWSYHFIGVEIIFFLLFGLVAEKIKSIKLIFYVWVVMAVILYLPQIINSFHQNPYINSTSLASEKKVVKVIDKDARENKFTVFAYSPSIYTYEYSYIFKWLDNKNVPYDPGRIKVISNIVYLIIPKVSDASRQDFINFRTPEKYFRTIKVWKMESGVIILKRQRMS